MNISGFEDLKMNGSADLSSLPPTLRAKLEGSDNGFSPNSARKMFFKKHFPEIYKGHEEPKTERHAKNLACLESLCENYLAMKMNRDYRLEKGMFVPITEGVNTTSDITNWAYLQMPMLAGMYFNNAFINLVSVQPARSRSGTFFKMDVQYADGAGAGDSIYGRGALDKTYADYTENGTVQTLKMTLATDTFTTTERALSAEVTDMLQQDLSAEHGIDAFRELMPMVAKELANIESTLLLDGLLAASAGFASALNWSKTPTLVDDNATTYNLKSYNQTLFDTINEVAVEIQKATTIRPTWLLMDLDTYLFIEQNLNTIYKDAYQNTLRSLTGASIDLLGRDNASIAYMGILGGKYDVYVDNTGYAGLADKIIVGSTSSTWLYQGMVYIPFILGFAPGRLRDYNKIFNQKEGILNRSGYKVVNAKFYGTVSIVA